MQGLALYKLASRQNEWLTQRQSLVASNIANANTPGYKTRDIQKFEAAMEDQTALAATNRAHFASSGAAPVAYEIQHPASEDVLVSGNNVSVEKEFLKSGEVMRSFALNTQVIKAFNRMLFAATKA